eukprot:6212293-Pleurochrysis_carterae.AAC.6
MVDGRCMGAWPTSPAGPHPQRVENHRVMSDEGVGAGAVLGCETYSSVSRRSVNDGQSLHARPRKAHGCLSFNRQAIRTFVSAIACAADV